MATAKIPQIDFKTNTDDMNLEIFCIIWLDDSENVQDLRGTEQKLRSIINRLRKFQDVEQCQKYIEQRSEQNRLILIVSGQLGEKLVPSIHRLRQVISIYVYCINKQRHKTWANNFSKVILS